MIQPKIDGILQALGEIAEDSTVPRNVKAKIQMIIDILRQDCETSIKVDKAMQELDGIAEDTNVQSYTRTQIWNIVSLLEKL